MTAITPPVGRPNNEHIGIIQTFAELVAEQKQDAYTVARLAVALGFMLIGTTTSKQVHYPVAPEQHTYVNLLEMDKRVQQIPEALGRLTLQAGYQCDIAVITGLFGDINEPEQRYDRAISLGLAFGRPESRFSWGLDAQKTRSFGYVPLEEACVRTYASPQMITAALDSDNPFTGAIDIIEPHSDSVRIAHDVAQYLIPAERHTIATIPLISNIDLPFDIVPTRYNPSKAA